MTKAITPYGIVDYEPSWLEKRLEDGVREATGIEFPIPERWDLSGIPDKMRMSRHYLGRDEGNAAIFYEKVVTTLTKERIPGPALRDNRTPLKSILGSPEYLEMERARLVFEDGIVVILHYGPASESADPESGGYYLTWGGGDLNALERGLDHRLPDGGSVRHGELPGRLAVEYALCSIFDSSTLL